MLVILMPLDAFSLAPGNGKAVGDDTEHLEHDVLAMMGAEEWEGVAVGFLLAKVHSPRNPVQAAVASRILNPIVHILHQSCPSGVDYHT